MNLFHRSALVLAIFSMTVSFSAYAQQGEVFASAEQSNTDSKKQTDKQPTQKVVVVTGARFSYKLVQKWIDDYNEVNPDVQIIIESRGSSDPTKFDILAEVYEQDDEIKKSREYINVGRYAILPVATSKSSFAKVYGDKGLNTELISQIFFHDIFADKEKEKSVKAPFTVYTRLQKAGVPIVFTKYFGFEQKDIKGKAIAGADEHLMKALLRDSTGVSYLPLPLIYDQVTKKPIAGLTVLPVDFNGNGKVNDEEKFYGDLTEVIKHLEEKDAKDIKNIPIEYLHLSIDKKDATPEAINFLKWVNENGQNDLHDFGYLKPEAKRFEKDKFNEFASKRSK
jgi:phosphate transport system substrate-binding protein